MKRVVEYTSSRTDWIRGATLRLLSRNQEISAWDAVVLATSLKVASGHRPPLKRPSTKRSNAQTSQLPVQHVGRPKVRRGTDAARRLPLAHHRQAALGR
jgi:hypothetical protein